ncbi:MAG: competence/damage-inducible protein A [Clostridiales Family XIII bacterium]|jgi:nicotinamide-nucleotide amidase|nr:competence/damage-inducible protein A [Clostridiales Family XIII bacterium]
MKATLISVGTELLFGQITNTNTVYLSEQLQLLGVDVLYHYTVGDNPERLRRMLRLAYEDCDLVITTGGLGPTQDDLTKEILTEELHDSLVLDQDALDAIEGFFKQVGRPMTENNRKQAYLPARAVIFRNANGTAPGFAIEDGERIAICLPGPPREMKPMFENDARPFLASKSRSAISYKLLRTFGLGESALETALEDLIDAQTDPTLATYAKEGECSLRIASKRATEAEARAAVEAMKRRVLDRIGSYVYSDDNEELAQVVARGLLAKNIGFSCAESCTGGMFAAEMTDIPGISAVFERGIVAYGNRAKTEELGVSREILERYGAVSRECALAMARGLSERTGSRLAIAVTGIAGPGGGTPEKPVGLTHIACVFDGAAHCKELRMRGGSRYRNRRYAVLSMLSMILRLIGAE